MEKKNGKNHYSLVCKLITLMVWVFHTLRDQRRWWEDACQGLRIINNKGLPCFKFTSLLTSKKSGVLKIHATSELKTPVIRDPGVHLHRPSPVCVQHPESMVIFPRDDS